MNFKSKLKETRNKLGLNQTQFADKTGFSRSTISEYENGTRKVTLTAIHKIANATKTNVSDWLDDTSEMDIKPFDGLNIVINTLKEVGEINNDGDCSEEAKKLLMKMLEQEIKTRYSNSKEN